MVQEHLRDLGGFAGAGGGDDDEAGMVFRGTDNLGMDLPDGKGRLHQRLEDKG
jgi:hypothetical protein